MAEGECACVLAGQDVVSRLVISASKATHLLPKLTTFYALMLFNVSPIQEVYQRGSPVKRATVFRMYSVKHSLAQRLVHFY